MRLRKGKSDSFDDIAAGALFVDDDGIGENDEWGCDGNEEMVESNAAIENIV